MQSITLSKMPGECYRSSSFKVYEVRRAGVAIGTIAQDFGYKWEVVNANLERISLHTTIKAALRVAGKAL